MSNVTAVWEDFRTQQKGFTVPSSTLNGLSRLKLSSDRKTTTVAHWSKSKGWEATARNAFSIPAKITCPGMTTGPQGCERVCYTIQAGAWPAVRRLVEHNHKQLREADLSGKVQLLGWMMDDFRAESAKAAKRHGPFPLKFRIHAEGDFYDVEYAKAWARVIRNNPDIQFWTYTRSFISSCNVVPILAEIPNLALYLSVDPENRDLAEDLFIEWGPRGVQLAFMDKTFDEAQEMAVAITGRRQPKCPEGWKTPLINEKGGACETCGLCITAKRPLLFSVTDK